jgi:hypothetical protein
VKYVEGKKAKGINPYPHKFPVTTTIPEYVAKYADLAAGEQLKDVTVALAGGCGVWVEGVLAVGAEAGDVNGESGSGWG